MASEVDTELELLRSFANTSLRKGSFIYEKVNDLLAQAAREKARLTVAAASTLPSDTITLRLRINIPGFNEVRSVDVKKGSSMESLKRSIETVTGAGYSADRVQSKRTGKAWGTFDSKSIEQCEMKHNDELVVECKNLNENLNPKGLERILTSGLVPQSTFQFVALTLHAFMLDEDFITVTELPNSTPGFAPSLKGKKCRSCTGRDAFSMLLSTSCSISKQNCRKELFCRITGTLTPPRCPSCTSTSPSPASNFS